MAPGEDTLKKISVVALCAMVTLLAGAIIFYKERVFFADTSFYIFTVVNSRGFCIQYNRYGAFITQLLPMLGQKLHLPLKILLMSYVVSFNLFFLTVAMLLVYKFKQYGLAILMSLYYFLFVSASFFWVNDEIHEAIAFMFLFFGAILYMGSKQTKMLLLLPPFVVLCFFTISTHFIAMIPMFYLWVYFILERRRWPFSRSKTIALSCAILLVIILKNVLTPMLPYDQEHLHGLTHISIQDIIDGFKAPVVVMFLKRCVTNYWSAMFVLAAGIWSLVKSKEKMLVLWTIACCIGYFLLMGITYASEDANVRLFHIETEWLSLGIIISGPFVFSFLPRIPAWGAKSLLGGIFLVRVAYMLSFFPAFNARIKMEEHILVQMRKKGIMKLALYNDEGLRQTTILDWALPFESILMSEQDGDKPERTFLFVNPDDKQTIGELNSRRDFYHAWTMLPYSDLNKAYFDIDTTKPYQIMTYAEFMK